MKLKNKYNNVSAKHTSKEWKIIKIEKTRIIRIISTLDFLSLQKANPNGSFYAR